MILYMTLLTFVILERYMVQVWVRAWINLSGGNYLSSLLILFYLSSLLRNIFLTSSFLSMCTLSAATWFLFLFEMSVFRNLWHNISSFSPKLNSLSEDCELWSYFASFSCNFYAYSILPLLISFLNLMIFFLFFSSIFFSWILSLSFSIFSFFQVESYNFLRWRF